jgi:hypothetical protein
MGGFEMLGHKIACDTSTNDPLSFHSPWALQKTLTKAAKTLTKAANRMEGCFPCILIQIQQSGSEVARFAGEFSLNATKSTGKAQNLHESNDNCCIHRFLSSIVEDLSICIFQRLSSPAPPLLTGRPKL